MENPFELVMKKLDTIEALLRNLTGKETAAVPIPASNEIFNTDKAAEYLSLKKSTLYKLTAQREVPHYKNGKKLYFKKSELDEWLTRQRISTNEEIDRMATEYILHNPQRRRW